MGNDFGSRDFNNLLFHGVELRRDLLRFAIDGNRQPFRSRDTGADRFCNRPGIAPEPRAERPHVGNHPYPALLPRSFKGNKDQKPFPALPFVGTEIVVGAIGDANGLYPPEPLRKYLRIPAVFGIVCPLIRQMLAEAELFRVNSDGYQEFMGECEVVGNVLIGDRAIPDGFAHRAGQRWLFLLLLGDGEKRNTVPFVP